MPTSRGRRQQLRAEARARAASTLPPQPDLRGARFTPPPPMWRIPEPSPEPAPEIRPNLWNEMYSTGTASAQGDAIPPVYHWNQDNLANETVNLTPGSMIRTERDLEITDRYQNSPEWRDAFLEQDQATVQVSQAQDMGRVPPRRDVRPPPESMRQRIERQDRQRQEQRAARGIPTEYPVTQEGQDATANLTYTQLRDRLERMPPPSPRLRPAIERQENALDSFPGCLPFKMRGQKSILHLSLAGRSLILQCMTERGSYRITVLHVFENIREDRTTGRIVSDGLSFQRRAVGGGSRLGHDVTHGIKIVSNTNKESFGRMVEINDRRAKGKSDDGQGPGLFDSIHERAPGLDNPG